MLGRQRPQGEHPRSIVTFYGAPVDSRSCLLFAPWALRVLQQQLLHDQFD